MKTSMSILLVPLANMNIMKWYTEITSPLEGEDYIRAEGISKMTTKVLPKPYRNLQGTSPRQWFQPRRPDELPPSNYVDISNEIQLNSPQDTIPVPEAEPNRQITKKSNRSTYPSCNHRKSSRRYTVSAVLPIGEIRDAIKDTRCTIMQG